MTQVIRGTAQQIVDVVPTVMRSLRAKLRERRAAGIKVTQFRAMLYIDRNEGASLSDVADHIGLTLPSMSKLIDGLVDRRLVSRRTCREDRRRISLFLTSQGGDELDAAYASAQRFLIEKMSRLSEEDIKVISQAMAILHGLFALDQEEQRLPQVEKQT